MSMEKIRGRIDELDEKLVELLNERATCAVEIGRIKRAQGIAIYQPEREAEVLRHVQGCTNRTGGPLSADAIARLFERIIDEGRRLERHVTETGEAEPVAGGPPPDGEGP